MAFNRFLSSLGPLRSSLALVSLTLSAIAPLAYQPVNPHTTSLTLSLFVPVMVPMILFVLLLEIGMTRVFMVEKTGAERQRLKRILWSETALLALLGGAWWPFFSSLLGR